MIELVDVEGKKVPQKLDLALDTSCDNLNAILQKIKNQPSTNYAFFYKNYEIQKNLKELLVEFQGKKLTTEDKLTISFIEESEFEIKPVTRISSSLEGHEKAVLAVAFSPNNKYLASVSGDKTLRLWDVGTETPYVKLEGHGDWVLGVSWSPNCRFIATGDNSGNVFVWDLNIVHDNLKHIRKCQREKKPDELNYKRLLRGHSKFITSLAWRPMHLEEESASFVTSSKDGSIRFWNAQMGTCFKICPRHSKSVTKVIWSGSDLVYSCSQDTKIIVWSATGDLLKTYEGHSHWVNCMSLNTHHSLRNGCFYFEQDERMNQEFLKNKKESALKLYNDQLKIVKKETIVSGSDDKTVILWQNDKPKRLTGHTAPINHIQFAPNGIIFMSASFDKSLRVWSVTSDASLAVLRGHVSDVYMLSFSKDSRWAVSGSKDSTLQVWSMKDKKRAYQLPGHADEVYGVDWSPDGVKLASGGKDKMVRLWKN